MDSFHPDYKKVPKHVGIIPDGGRRWAEKNKISLTDSYKVTLNKLYEISDFLISRQISMISIYVSSIQNYKRAIPEINAFTQTLITGLAHQATELAIKYDLIIKIVGNKEAFSDQLLEIINESDYFTIDTVTDKKRVINLCIAYNPIQEIIEAISYTPKYGVLTDYLWINEPLNMVIRSGDANLISNFLPLQSGYARLYFVKELFNDLTNKDIEELYDQYVSVNRKYGE
jgi:undecaprenyl diphosphate synthase